MDHVTRLIESSPADWVPTLTLIYLLATQPWSANSLSGELSQALAVCGTLAASAGLLIPDLTDATLFWGVLAAVHLSWVASSYHVADNHHFLIGYWALAIGLSLLSPDRDVALSRSAEILIALCFLVAVGAKLASRSYRTSSFFVWELVTDPRFLPLAVTIGGLTSDQQRRHLTARTQVLHGHAEEMAAPIPRRLWMLAVGLTWWTIVIEILIGVLFVLPVEGLEAIRTAVLAIFVVTTFSFVSVAPFGQLLLIMLLAATPDVAMRSYLLVLAGAIALIGCVPQAARRLIESRRAASRAAFARVA